MPNEPKTQSRSVKINDDDWQDLGKAVEQNGTDRAAVLNAFIRWYVGRPGAELPQRPDAR